MKTSGKSVVWLVTFILGAWHSTAGIESSYKYLGCESFKSQYFDSVYSLLRDGISREQLAAHLSFLQELKLDNIEEIKTAAKSDEDLYLLNISLMELNQYLLLNAPIKGEDINSYQLYQRVVGVEVGDSTTEARVKYREQVERAFQKVEKNVEQLGLQCQHEETAKISDKDILSTSVAAGVSKFFKIFYQDCDAFSKATYGPSHEDLDGVDIVGRHPAGGYKRVIGSLSDVLRTHYHLKSGGEYGSRCFDWRSSPPIYDFGGKPYVSNNNLDFFRNSGSGTSVLGIDCSGVVISALAAAGRRPKKDTIFKPDFVHNVNSSMLKEPQSNGLSCLEKVQFSPSNYQLQGGDILAIRGHVTIVSSTGNDPWGLSRISNVSQCSISNFSTSNFDFSIVQSAPVKGAVGVTHMKAKDYYSDTGSQGKALREHAVNACFAKFGSSTRTNVSYLSVVRHSGESGCFQNALPFENEECVSSCI